VIGEARTMSEEEIIRFGRVVSLATWKPVVLSTGEHAFLRDLCVRSDHHGVWSMPVTGLEMDRLAELDRAYEAAASPVLTAEPVAA
jgi:hypothetical protein